MFPLRPISLVAALVLAPAAAQAQAPVISVEAAECFPTERNGLVNATVRPEVGGSTVRLYFRWDDHGGLYFVDMFAAGDGAYWGLPARPEVRNTTVEYSVAVLDAYGRPLATSETLLAPVREDCIVELTPKQVGAANNLVVGETVPDQQGQRVMGFLCDGVVTRVNHEGIMRPDEVCRGCVIPWWNKAEFFTPAVGLAGLIVLDQPPPTEQSPSRPQ